ncbi:15-hydroxyprostaglandin dehydrogenase [NAD(+)]-like [Anopheles ziemanni]|uniref:15-hydroxyprostaglandin dehydrogenase [NAD(+)]-like n=2 Tax=coustani group TaxID=59130 RepID=UPI00265F58A8|nr:15-hydroxyprostaglandin dehydrogenase [NAD(+)]-like [Anopheles ziemanni]
MELENKVALVTGGATGLGRAICEQLLKHGAKVLICDLNEDAERQVVEELGKLYGNRIVCYTCDVTDCLDFEEAFEYILCKFLGIDIVINNAKVMNDNFWELEVDVNLNGVIRGTLLAQKFMCKQRGHKGGVVVNIASSASIQPQISTPIYTATMHGIIGLTKACGDPFHYQNSNVRVFAYCPGPIEKTSEEETRGRGLPAYDEAKEMDKAVATQKAEHVAKELIPLLKNASTGSIWLVTEGKPAVEIPYTTF